MTETEIDFAQAELRVFNQHILNWFERLLSKLHLLRLYWIFRSRNWKWHRIYNQKGNS